MVVEWAWAAITTFLGWLLGLFPTIELPEWVADVATMTTEAVAYINGWHNWVPLDAVRNTFLFVMVCSGIVLAVRGFRIVLSLFTGGGGSAA